MLCARVCAYVCVSVYVCAVGFYPLRFLAVGGLLS